MDEVMWADTRALRGKVVKEFIDQLAVLLVFSRIAGRVSRSEKR
jgi:hypothetical protein